MTDYTAGFERFWQAYPKYKRKGKGAAFKSWQKHNLEDKAADIVHALEAQCQHDDHFKKYTPLPTTYLNQGRYDDDIPQPARAYAPDPEPDRPFEQDKYVASVKRVAVPWLWRRGGIPEDKVGGFAKLVRSLAEDAKELHERGELTDRYAKVIRRELNDYMERA